MSADPFRRYRGRRDKAQQWRPAVLEHVRSQPARCAPDQSTYGRRPERVLECRGRVPSRRQSDGNGTELAPPPPPKLQLMKCLQNTLRFTYTPLAIGSSLAGCIRSQVDTDSYLVSVALKPFVLILQ
jgi:hypothetical protein